MSHFHRLSWAEIEMRASAFSARWNDPAKHNEKSYAQGFVGEFLKVFGADWLNVGHLEDKSIEGYSDYLWKSVIAIEMKSRGADRGFEKAASQLKRYTQNLPLDEHPKLWMACDFENIRLWQIETGQRFDFKTNKLKKYARHFAILAGHAAEHIRADKEYVNIQAAEKMAKLHESLKDRGYSDHDLQVYVARLLFCLFANDTGIFHQDIFHAYVEASLPNGSDLDARLSRIFQDLNEKVGARVVNPFLSEGMERFGFRYVNGGLFSERLRQATFDKKTRQTLLDCLDFDWSQISPDIFGSMFQCAMDGAERREIGAHYTSEENILKLINPLFMDALWEEFARAKKKASPKAIADFHAKLVGLKFLDPACGCGNFLIIAYRELRRLELDVVREEMRLSKGNGHKLLNIETHFKVGVEQFYGIEILPWPCQIAMTGMWLMDHLMNMEASEEFGEYYDRLPLGRGASIVCGNALRLDWEGIVPKMELDCILGNPPFGGARLMAPSHKKDMEIVFGDTPSSGNLDYVAAWYKKAADYMEDTGIRAAFVSTSSINQGEQAGLLWGPLMGRGLTINFGVQSFKWESKAKGRAAVHCVIVGFRYDNGVEKKLNSYLEEAPAFFLKRRQKPICDVPEIGIGNKPIDGGNYLFTEDEMKEFVRAEPLAKKWFRPWVGADEFINGYFSYCLWLGDCPPSELRKMPLCMERVEAVKAYRLASKSGGTVKIASEPTSFHVENMPDIDYLLIPSVSSEKRGYIPMGFMHHKTLASNLALIIPGATLYHFGILTSSVHMAWTRAVCGRLKSDYRYSKDIVYNNFPWPDATDAQKAKIEELAQGVLDARGMFRGNSLSDLYDPLAMPRELLKVHKALDRAVMKLYGFGKEPKEADIMAKLIEMHKKLVAGG